MYEYEYGVVPNVIYYGFNFWFLVVCVCYVVNIAYMYYCINGDDCMGCVVVNCVEVVFYVVVVVVCV